MNKMATRKTKPAPDELKALYPNGTPSKSTKSSKSVPTIDDTSDKKRYTNVEEDTTTVYQTHPVPIAPLK